MDALSEFLGPHLARSPRIPLLKEHTWPLDLPWDLGLLCHHSAPHSPQPPGFLDDQLYLLDFRAFPSYPERSGPQFELPAPCLVLAGRVGPRHAHECLLAVTLPLEQPYHLASHEPLRL